MRQKHWIWVLMSCFFKEMIVGKIEILKRLQEKCCHSVGRSWRSFVENKKRAILPPCEQNRNWIRSNLRLVVSIAKNIQIADFNFWIWFRKAILGWWKPLTNLNTNGAINFPTYATWWIRQAITRATCRPGKDNSHSCSHDWNHQ